MVPLAFNTFPCLPFPYLPLLYLPFPYLPLPCLALPSLTFPYLPLPYLITKNKKKIPAYKAKCPDFPKPINIYSHFHGIPFIFKYSPQSLSQLT